MAITLVSTVTVGSGGAASITFTGIAATGKDLLILASLRSDASGFGYDILKTEVNNLTTGDSSRFLVGDGSSAFSQNPSRIDSYINSADETANTFSNTAIYISNYGSSAAKSFSLDGVMENNATSAYQTITAGVQTDTAAITSIQLDQAFGSNFVQHSTASLYIIS